MNRLIFYVSLFFVFIFKSFVFAADQVEITKISGEVKVLFENTTDYQLAEEGMLLKQGDKVKTLSNASAELSFNEDDSNVVRISENSDLTVTLKEDEKLDMSVGEVFATVSNLPQGSSFEIRTPTAVSGARGTDWVTTVSDDGTDVEAIDSVPYVRHFESTGVVSNEKTLIQPGQMTKVRKFNRPMLQQSIKEQSREKWKAVKQNMRQHIQQARVRREQNPRFDRDKFIQRMKEKNIKQPLSQDMGKVALPQFRQLDRVEKNKSRPRVPPKNVNKPVKK